MNEINQVLTMFIPMVSGLLLIKSGYSCFKDGLRWRWADFLLAASAVAVLIGLWHGHTNLALILSGSLVALFMLKSLFLGATYYWLIAGNCDGFQKAAERVNWLLLDARRGLMIEQSKAAKLMVQGDRNTAYALLERVQKTLPLKEQYWNEMLMLAGARSAMADKETVERAAKILELKLDPASKSIPLLILALAHMKNGEPEEAFAALQRIECFVPPTYKNIFELGLRSALGCRESMEATISRNRVPEFAAMYFRAFSDYARGNHDEARSKFKQAVALVDADPRSGNYFGWKEACEYRLKNMNDEALPIYTLERENRLESYLQAISNPSRKRRLVPTLAPVLAPAFGSASAIGSVVKTEHVEPHHCAGFSRRFLATSLDCGLVFVISILAFYGLPLITGLTSDLFFDGARGHALRDGVEIAAVMLGVTIALACTLLYGPLFESSRLQATPGKYLLNLSVARIDGTRMQFREAMNKQFLQHTLGAVLGIVFPVYAASYVILTGKHKQTIYDKVGNRVVLTKGPPRTRLLVVIATILMLVAGAVSISLVRYFSDIPRSHSDPASSQNDRQSVTKN